MCGYLCVYMYMCIRVYVFICRCVCRHIYIHTDIRIYIYTRNNMYIYTHTSLSEGGRPLQPPSSSLNAPPKTMHLQQYGLLGAQRHGLGFGV